AGLCGRGDGRDGIRLHVEYAKLCKWHPSRKYRGEVLVTYRAGGTAVDMAITTREAGRVHKTRRRRKGWWPNVWSEWFSSKWVGNSFVVKDRLGRETARLSNVPSLVSKAKTSRGSE
ncbi:MAG: hypothetical protein KDC38_00325, partial [Planctomycetes bacterium]|nr:hypothetical protein [Planctomycetota bacterium]